MFYLWSAGSTVSCDQRQEKTPAICLDSNVAVAPHIQTEKAQPIGRACFKVLW
jgi:hypothetical protein